MLNYIIHLTHTLYINYRYQGTKYFIVQNVVLIKQEIKLEDVRNKIQIKRDKTSIQ